MKMLLSRLGLLTILSVPACLFGVVETPAQSSSNVFAVTSTNQLARFNTATPGTVTTFGPITGLQAGENILGIDFRPVTGELFALGSTSSLYVINRTTAAATLVAPLSVALSGTAFGFDFNPVVDRIRIVSNTGQNLRVNPANGVAIVDNIINGPTMSVDAASYTNSFNGAANTTLYDISATTDTLYIQNPPNNGTITPVGSLGINVTDVNGFDILSTDSTAYATLTVGGTTGLFTINLTSGAATLIGNIGAGSTSYEGLAIEPGLTPNYVVYGVTTANNLVRFNSFRPNTILSNVAITGLQGGESVLGIDFRPGITGQLFALGSTSRLYRIDTRTGAATQIGSAGAFTLTGTSFGFDVDRTSAQIRVTSDTGQNLRLNSNGTIGGIDPPLAFAVGDPNFGVTPTVVGSAYTTRFDASPTLYDIDANLNILTTQIIFGNNGTLNTVGALGVNITNEAGFDIATGSGIALAAFQVTAGGASSLYSVNLTTGAAGPIGPIGGLTLRDLAIGSSTVSNAATATIDFDGDGRTDYAVFRPSTNTWYLARSSDNSFIALQFGLTGDVLTPGDFDGDGRTDVAVWRSSEGLFYVLRSSDGGVTIVRWGTAGDEPIARDFDGDGRTDFAVVRRTGGLLIWYVLNTSNGSVRVEQFGLATDVAVPGDYNGDGLYDLAVYRGALGMQANFFVQTSTTSFSVTPWGLGGDRVVTGDYDGDGRTDFAVVRPGVQSTWFVRRSSDGAFYADWFGTSMHSITQGDYDGDARTDFSTWNPANGIFYFLRTAISAPISQYPFGLPTDVAVGNYDTH